MPSHVSFRAARAGKRYAERHAGVAMHGRRGVTLIEMLVVVTIVGLAAAIAYPAVNTGVDSLRLRAAGDSIVSFLNAGLNRAERRQQLVEIVISRPANSLTVRSEEPGFSRELGMPEGIAIVRLHPESFEPSEENERSYVLYPGGTVPRLGIEIANRRGARRIIRVDPITGVPQVETVSE